LFKTYQSFHRSAPFQALRRFKVQGSRVQGDFHVSRILETSKVQQNKLMEAQGLLFDVRQLLVGNQPSVASLSYPLGDNVAQDLFGVHERSDFGWI
jgi:hypothetical protein